MTSSPWFRYHAIVLNNKRVQDLPGDLFKFWVNVMSHACLENVGKSGEIPSIDDCAYALRMKRDDCFNAFQDLVSRGLMVTDGETFQIAKWGEKQYKSDSSTERVRKHRKQKETVTETPPDSDQIQIQIPPKPPRGAEPSSKRPKPPSGGRFMIMSELSDVEIDKLRQEFQGDDLGFFGKEYDKRIADGSMQQPRAPYPAFRGYIVAMKGQKKT